MEVIQKRFVEVVDGDQADDVGEVLMAPGGQLQLDQVDTVNELYLADLLADQCRIGKRNGGPGRSGLLRRNQDRLAPASRAGAADE